MAARPSGGTVPILVLPEGTLRRRGRDARSNNIAAVKIVSEAVRSTLGPRGMDKMLVDNLGDVTISNDGATILDEMDIEHPAAKMITEVAETQDNEVGDGTTTAVVIAGALLKEAEELLEQNIHPSIIITGYGMAAQKAQEILEGISENVSFEEDGMLRKVAMTAMTGKKAESARKSLAEIAVKAAKQVAEEKDGKYKVGTGRIKVEKREGGSIDDTFLVDGIIIDKERVHPGMPTRVKDAKIALLNTSLEVKKTETDAKIKITDPEQMQAFLDEEEKTLMGYVDKITDTGANAVMNQKGIDDLVQHYLAERGIFAARRVKKSDMKKLARATGGETVTNIDDLSPENLGEAGLVEERKISGEEMTFIEDCKDPKAVSILIRGGTEHVVDEAERSLNDAIKVVGKTIEDGRVVAGGGATEIELTKNIRDYADTVSGREALAVGKFADAIETIARTLAENAGTDVIDTLLDLRAKHKDKKDKNFGLDVYSEEIVDMIENGVIEPLPIKTNAIKSATETAAMILRIDDVIAAKEEEMPSPGGEGPEGMY